MKSWLYESRKEAGKIENRVRDESLAIEPVNSKLLFLIGGTLCLCMLANVKSVSGGCKRP